MVGRRSLAVVTALLVVLAGCSAAMPGAPDTNQSGDDGTGSDTADQGLDPSVEPIYEPPLNTTEVAVDHTVELRRAGSFTYQATVTIVDSNQSARMSFGRTASVAMDTGEMVIRRNRSDMTRESVYVTGNGTTYVKVATSDGTVAFNKTNGTIDTSRYAINGVPRFLDTFELEYDGATTMDGERVYRYSATSPEQVTSLQGLAGQDSGRNLSKIEAQLYVTESGLVKKLGYTLGFDTGQGLHNIKAVTTYENVGTEPVARPDWIADADAAARGELSETRTIENETLGASLTVTANRNYFDQIQIVPGAGPYYNGDGAYEAAAASSTVTVVIPPSAENASITLAYDEAEVPEGGEEDLALYQYVPTQNTWEQLNATHDVEANTFSKDIPKSAVVVVLHEPSWESVTNSTE